MFNWPPKSIAAKDWSILGIQTTIVGVSLLVILSCSTFGVLASENYNTLISHATKLMKTGQPQQAVVLLKQAKTLRPKSARARANLGWAYYQLGNVDAAYKEAQEAVKLDYKNAFAHQCLVLLYVAKNMPSEAAKEMRIMRKLNPNQKCNCPMDSLFKLNRPGLSGRKY